MKISFMCTFNLDLDLNPGPRLITDSDTDPKLQIFLDPAGSGSTTLVATLNLIHIVCRYCRFHVFDNCTFRCTIYIRLENVST
jgi:hypothetical protein